MANLSGNKTKRKVSDFKLLMFINFEKWGLAVNKFYLKTFIHISIV